MADMSNPQEDLETILARIGAGIESGMGKIQIEVVYCAFCSMKLGFMVLDAKEAVGWKNEGCCVGCVKRRVFERRGRAGRSSEALEASPRYRPGRRARLDHRPPGLRRSGYHQAISQTH